MSGISHPTDFVIEPKNIGGRGAVPLPPVFCLFERGITGCRRRSSWPPRTFRKCPQRAWTRQGNAKRVCLVSEELRY